jgi:outer membrane murein-binding lipoprotein Lpp
MKDAGSFRKAGVAAILALGTVGLLTGCATKKYVRTQVDTSAHGLSARMDKLDKGEEGLNSGIQANSNQIEELNGVTRDHSGKISNLDSGLKQTDSKAQQALTVGDDAQNTANKAVTQISSLDSEFQNRNHYVVLHEEQVRFKFNSDKLEPSFKQVLDEIEGRRVGRRLVHEHLFHAHLGALSTPPLIDHYLECQVDGSLVAEQGLDLGAAKRDGRDADGPVVSREPNVVAELPYALLALATIAYARRRRAP